MKYNIMNLINIKWNEGISMRKTKIVCTIGPASSDPKVFTKMCKAGLNVARLNFSHGTHSEQLEKLNMVKKVREELDLPIAIMLDTKGPEYRIKTFENGKIMLNDGDEFSFTTEDIVGNQSRVSVTYAGLVDDISIGDRILVNNGLVIFEVIGKTDTDVKCKVIAGGELSNRKSMSFPNKVLNQVYLSEQDKDDLLFGIQNNVDYIAASFVSCRQDLIDLKEFLHANGGDGIDIIAKIENRTGIDNIEDICEECDGIMIGRGDLGVEVPFTARQARYHGYRDARINDNQSPPDESGNFRRCERCLRRHERGHALRRISCGQISCRDSPHDGRDSRRNGEAHPLRQAFPQQ